MGLLTHLFYPWGLLLQAAAIIHFIRRRPDTYWLFIIIFLGTDWRDRRTCSRKSFRMQVC